MLSFVCINQIRVQRLISCSSSFKCRVTDEVLQRGDSPNDYVGRPLSPSVAQQAPVQSLLIMQGSRSNTYILTYACASYKLQVVGRVIVDEPLPTGRTFWRPSSNSSSSVEAMMGSPACDPATPMQENNEFSSILNC